MVTITAVLTHDEEGAWVAEALGLCEGFAAAEAGQTETEALHNLAQAVAALLSVYPDAINPDTRVVSNVLVST